MSRVALVTGAGSGIGRAVSLALNASGYSVVLAGRRAEELERTAANSQMLAVPTDVTQPDAVEALFDRIQQAFGRLDVLFNNAGIGAPAMPIEEIPFDKWQAVVATNLTGVFLCTQEAIKILEAERDIQKGEILQRIKSAKKALCGQFTISAGTVKETLVEAYTRKAYRNFRVTEKG